MLALLCALAAAAPALHVEEDSVVWSSPASPPLATLLLDAAGAPRISLYNVGGYTTQALLVPEGDAWRELPVPRGRVMEGTEDVVVLRMAQEGAVTPGWLALQDGAWVASDGPLPDGDSVGAVGLSPDGALTVVQRRENILYQSIYKKSWRHRRVDDGANYGRVEGGRVWWLASDGLRGPSPRVWGGLNRAEARTFGFDAASRPALAVVSGDTLTVEHAGGTARLALPGDSVPAPERCLDHPCAVTHNDVWLRARRGVVAWQGGLLVPYSQRTETGEMTCRPFEGDLHPCDPAGLINTCPDPPRWSCDTPTELAEELRAAWVRGSAVQDLPLGELLGSTTGAAPAVFDQRAGPDGRLHLLVGESGGGTAWLVRYVRLGPAAGDRVSRPVRAAPGVSLDALDELSLGVAGFATTLNSAAAGRSPAFEDGVAVTGGAHGPGWWSRDLSAVPTDAPVTLTVGFEVHGDEGCGGPVARMVRGGAGVEVSWLADGLSLRPLQRDLPVRLPPLGPGAHTLALSVDAAGVRVSVDGAEVYAHPTSAPLSPFGAAGFGAFDACPGGAAVETRWSSVALAVAEPGG